MGNCCTEGFIHLVAVRLAQMVLSPLSCASAPGEEQATRSCLKLMLLLHALAGSGWLVLPSPDG